MARHPRMTNAHGQDNPLPMDDEHPQTTTGQQYHSFPFHLSQPSPFPNPSLLPLQSRSCLVFFPDFSWFYAYICINAFSGKVPHSLFHLPPSVMKESSPPCCWSSHLLSFLHLVFIVLTGDPMLLSVSPSSSPPSSSTFQCPKYSCRNALCT